MPAGIAASDRKILWIGGALLLLLLTASVVFAPPSEQFSSPIPSTNSAQSGGAQAAYRLLSQLHYPVRRWEDPPTQLFADPVNVLLILAEPTQPPSENEKKALLEFVEDGGHVLFTGPDIEKYFSQADISRISPDPKWESFSPSIPSGLSRGAPRVTIQPQAYWGRLEHSQFTLYGEPDSSAVVRWYFGDGQILWWAGSTPLTNAGITKDDNLAFFLNSVANWSPKEPYRIYWDEYFHGERSSVWSYFGKTSLRWGVVQFALLALAVLFTFSRRSGPIFIPAGVSRLSPLEFVDTLGGLYDRAGAASSAVSISYLRLRALLTRQLSLPANIPDADLAQAAEQRLGWKNSDLAKLFLQAGAASRMEKLPRREALELVQKLEQHAAKLNVRTQFRQEQT